MSVGSSAGYLTDAANFPAASATAQFSIGFRYYWDGVYSQSGAGGVVCAQYAGGANFNQHLFVQWDSVNGYLNFGFGDGTQSNYATYVLTERRGIHTAICVFDYSGNTRALYYDGRDVTASLTDTNSWANVPNTSDSIKQIFGGRAISGSFGSLGGGRQYEDIFYVAELLTAADGAMFHRGALPTEFCKPYSWFPLRHTIARNEAQKTTSAWTDATGLYRGQQLWVPSHDVRPRAKVAAAAAGPEITVSGNSVNIVDGDATPSATDHTDFGSIDHGGATVSRTFTVSNTGTSDLTTSGLTVPTGFTVTEGLSATIAASGSDTFTVRLDNVTAGVKSGDISFTTNDSDENPFNFAITGTVAAAPILSVQGNFTTIANGQSTPLTTNHTDFGTVVEGGTAVQRVFTINNGGSAPLTTASLSVPSGFTTVDGLSASIAAGGSDTITISLPTTTAGTYSGNITWTHNDATVGSPFVFAITGTITAPPPPPPPSEGIPFSPTFSPVAAPSGLLIR